MAGRLPLAFELLQPVERRLGLDSRRRLIGRAQPRHNSRTQQDERGEGHAGGRARAMIKRAAGGEEQIKSKIVSTLRKGDRLHIITAGGGGYGSPAHRDPASVQTDLRDGKISPEAAHEFYAG